jgi:hypothetical protein
MDDVFNYAREDTTELNLDFDPLSFQDPIAKERLRNLASFQLSVILHAFSFPKGNLR